MLEVVERETLRIESRFLEPACGTGNFLSAILDRKLDIVGSRYSRQQSDYEWNALVAVSSVYGIDLLSDNVSQCRSHLFEIVRKRYVAKFGKRTKREFLKSIHFVIERNIVAANALTMKLTSGNDADIVFVEWSMLGRYLIKRREFKFGEVIGAEDMNRKFLLGSLEGEAIIPKAVADYPPIHYLDLWNDK